MKPTQKQVIIGDKFETTDDLFAMDAPGDAFGKHTYIKPGTILEIIKPRVVTEGINSIKFLYGDKVCFSWWIHFKTFTKRV